MSLQHAFTLGEFMFRLEKRLTFFPNPYFLI